MVDELMLRDVKNILSKIEVVRSREYFSEFIKSLNYKYHYFYNVVSLD